MPLPALLLPILAAAAQAPAPPKDAIVVTGRPWAPFISPMGEPFRARASGEDTLARWFHQADRNQDGALTADEMQADAERFFAKLDTDHNGAIEPEEIVEYEWEIAPEIQVASRWRKSRPGAPVAQASGGEPGREGRGHRRGEFGETDNSESSDGLGYSLQGAARYALLNIPQPVAAADTNFDRSITLSEFRLASVARFQFLDLARQGKLTLQQLEALRPADPKSGRHPKRRKDALDTRYGVPLPPGD
jgi:hypothetical protein